MSLGKQLPAAFVLPWKWLVMSVWLLLTVSVSIVSEALKYSVKVWISLKLSALGMVIRGNSEPSLPFV